jgi:hypothetical protein
MMKNQAAPHARYIPALLDWSRLPAHERVLDGLADLIMNASDILDILSHEDAEPLRRAVAAEVQKLYDCADALMKRLAD